jgi:hypothetical protein
LNDKRFGDASRPIFKTDVLKISDKVYKIEGNVNMQGEPNYFIYEQKGKRKSAMSM